MKRLLLLALLATSACKPWYRFPLEPKYRGALAKPTCLGRCQANDLYGVEWDDEACYCRDNGWHATGEAR